METRRCGALSIAEFDVLATSLFCSDDALLLASREVFSLDSYDEASRDGLFSRFEAMLLANALWPALWLANATWPAEAEAPNGGAFGFLMADALWLAVSREIPFVEEAVF